MNVMQEKAKQRNITPNFLRFRRKSTANSIGKKTGDEDKIEMQNPSERGDRTERSASRTSRCSFEAYQRRILHLSKLKHQVNQYKEGEEGRPRKNHIVLNDPTTRTREREQSPYDRGIHTERDYDTRTNTVLHKLQDSRKRNSASGKIINKVSGRVTSTPKRSEESLEKEDQRAKAMNVELMNNMMKNNMAPNYMGIIKKKKMENANEKKRSKRVFNFIVPVKGEEETKNYDIFGELGKGAYGLVRMGVDKRTNEKVAIKIYDKRRIDEPNKVKNLEREINILAELSHPTIAKLTDVVETQHELYLILEYGGANSLYNYLLSKPEHRLSQAEAKKFLLVIGETLQYLHDLDIIHRDIKAQNILINRHKQLKLIDFGFSLRCKKTGTIDTFCGTPTYMAPEIVSKVDHSPIYTDMWSLGILFYVMLQGNYPFRAKNENDLFEKIKRGHFEYIHSDISKESKQIIEGLLRVHPHDRLTIHDLLSKDNRKWLAQQ